MPLLSITLRGAELLAPRTLLLERPYSFTKLKLQHVYHNIDSINFKDTIDKAQAVLLYLKLGGLVDNHKQIISYHGDYSLAVSHQIQPHYDNSDHQLSGDIVAINSELSTSHAKSSTRITQNVDVDHLVPIGASKHNTAEIISRDLFKTLHDGGVLEFNGELTVSLHYMNGAGSIKPVDETTDGIQTEVKQVPLTTLTMVFEYDE